jgi:hypothetical protein
MKSLPRIGCQFLWSSLLVATLGAAFGLAQTPDDPPNPKGPPAILRRAGAEAKPLRIDLPRAYSPSLHLDHLRRYERRDFIHPLAMHYERVHRIELGQCAGDEG